MPTTDPTCPKCQSPMVQGFLADYTYGAVQPANWVDGPPKKSFWSHTKVSEDEQIPVGTFRCSSCGYLESYARREFARR